MKDNSLFSSVFEFANAMASLSVTRSDAKIDYRRYARA
jgi:hypothetical protein